MWALWISLAAAGEDFEGQSYYLGELHSHTGASGDGGSSDLGGCSSECGAVADLGTTARELGLDFMAVTDHVNGPASATAQNYAQVLAALLGAHDPEGGLVTIPGAEIWLRWPDGSAVGHKDLLFFDDDTALLQTLRMGDNQPFGDTSLTLDDCDALWTWMAELEARLGPALLLPHHPALSQPMETDWTCHSDAYSPGVEIYSTHGNSLSDPTDYDPGWSPAVPESTVESALNLGLTLGFLGGTDTHDTRPGAVCAQDPEQPDHPYGGSLTVVVAPQDQSLSRGLIHQAILDRRTYTTTGPLVPVRVEWRVDGASVGGHGAAPDVPQDRDLGLVLQVPVPWAADVSSVRLRGPGAWWTADASAEGTWTWSLPAAELPPWLYVDVTLDGEQPDGCVDGGDDTLEHLWLSPVRPTLGPAVGPGETGAPADSRGQDSPPTDSAGGEQARCSGCGALPAPARWGWGLIGAITLGWRRRVLSATEPRRAVDNRSL